MSDRDYYEILGLTPKADGVMVDQAYWHLARKYQSLAETNPSGQRLLNQLNEAYGVLGNPRLREQYDAFRDDVLIQQGLVQPVKSKPQKPSSENTATAGQKPAARRLKLPALKLAHWRTYALSTIIAALAFAGAWQGLNIIFVGTALAAGLGLSLAPTVGTRLSQAHLSLPSMTMPSVSMPSMSAPRISMPDIQMPGLRDFGGAKDESIDADALRASTAATIQRWRNSVGLKASLIAEQDAAPSTTLVEIVESERDIDGESEPMNSVLDILRGNRSVETR